MGINKLAILRPVRLRLEKPLEGPYTRILRRPVPEVQALGSGETIAIVRALRITEPIPLYASRIASYYPLHKKGGGLRAEDFRNVDWADDILATWLENEDNSLSYLVVPVGHIRLPNEKWVSSLTGRITPWSDKIVEQWRRGLKRDIWLNMVRIYRCNSLTIPPLPPGEIQSKVRPLRLANLEAVLEDQIFEERLNQVVSAIDVAQEDQSEIIAISAKSQSERKMVISSETAEAYSLADFAADSGFNEAEIGTWKKQLARKKQLIFYGPPGTGKTYLAQRLARHFIAGADGFSETVQFHPSFAYEDFIQGIRPQTAEQTMTFELKQGRFLLFCTRSRKVVGPCVLIIDEINRAHVSRVFGELMYLLEYRDEQIALAAGGSCFKIPENVYMIGTMNTADRSIALVDQALRRRFSFVKIAPNYLALERYLEKCKCPAAGLIDQLKEINDSIGDANCELGISFFMRQGEDLREVLSLIWTGEIEPYLEEVFYDRPEQLENFRWQAVKRGKLRQWQEK